MAKRKPEEPDLVALALELVAEGGWSRLTMAALAERAGLSLVEIYRLLPGRRALLARLGRRLDETMLAVDRSELLDMPPRDRVLELLMRRIDGLQAHRAGIVALAHDLRADPCALLATLCGIDRGMTWLVDAAGIEATGLRRAVLRRALALAYARTLRVWLADETEDLGKTMAELDRRVTELHALGLIGGEAPAGPAPGAAADTAPG
jgi:AcrR family transcriptional regulator